MLEASMVASTTERVRSPSSRLIVPAYLPNRPRTFENTMCRIEKLMPEWAASRFQLVVVMGSSSICVGASFFVAKRYDRSAGGTREPNLELLFYVWNNRLPVDLNEMLVFARVVQAGSFTTAAAELGMPKSTVSRKVSELEERLNARLLQRTTRSASLTDIG